MEDPHLYVLDLAWRCRGGKGLLGLPGRARTGVPGPVHLCAAGSATSRELETARIKINTHTHKPQTQEGDGAPQNVSTVLQQFVFVHAHVHVFIGMRSDFCAITLLK